MHPIIQAEVDEFRKKVDSSKTMGFDSRDADYLEIESFLSAALQRAIERAGKEMVGGEHKIPYQALLFQDCPKCGQEVNRDWVDNTTKEVADEARSLALSKLDTIINFKE